MIWLADLGNTRLKLARSHAGQIEYLADFAHADTDFPDTLARWLSSHELPAKIWLAAVATSVIKDRVIEIFTRAGIPVAQVRTQRTALGLTTDYIRHEQLGVDRWLALLALHVEGTAPCVVASIGSALTCDALDTNGHHLGGLIAPTPEAMQAALLSRAPGLATAVTMTDSIGWFSRSTETGIASGCLLASTALITRFHQTLSEHLQTPVRLVITGGAAAVVRPWLPTHTWRPNLVLAGLNTWLATIPE